MGYVLGIEGGGTKSLMRLCDTSSNIMAESIGDCLNVSVIGYDNVMKNLNMMYKQILKEIDYIPTIDCVCIGTAGMIGDEIKEFYTSSLKHICNCTNVLAYTDAYIALYGHLGKKAGISITSGTGSNCVGKDNQNNVKTCGGWGHVFSDEGSAYDIAIDGLRYVYGSVDKRNGNTLLCDEFLRATNTKNINELLGFVYSKETNKTVLASLARIVDYCANQNDEYAQIVLTEAADKLFDMCQNVANNLLFDESTSFSVVFNGSVLTNSTILKEKLTKIINEKYINCSIVKQENDAVHGAIYLAIMNLKGE